MAKFALLFAKFSYVRLCGEDFYPEYDPSMEDNYTKTCHFPGYGQVDLSILDTAGQIEYSSLDDQWIREGILLKI